MGGDVLEVRSCVTTYERIDANTADVHALRGVDLKAHIYGKVASALRGDTT
jgi:hypothetical protein